MEQAVQSSSTLEQRLQQSETENAMLRARVASFESLNAGVESVVENAKLKAEIAGLRTLVNSQGSIIKNLVAENELLRRHQFGRKSERTNTSELQLVMKSLFPEEELLQAEYEAALCPGHSPDNPGDNPKPKPDKKPCQKPKGRRDLSVSTLPRIVVEIVDEDLAKQGRVIRYDDSYQLMRIQGGFRVLQQRTAIYEVEVSGSKTLLAANQPRRLFPRSMCHTSVYAWLAWEKFCMGVPHYRLEQHLESEEESIDRGSMSRYMEDLGGLLGATIVHAMFEDARTNCHVLSTDATGALIQPVPRADKRRQACDKGHFFTIVADCDHVLFHYTESHTSDVVAKLFKGFTGFLQADASSVYDILERGPSKPDEDRIQLVGCWAHCRRYFFDAAVTKHAGALEGLRRIREMYSLEKQYAKYDLPERARLRKSSLAPLIHGFFGWIEEARRSHVGRDKLSQALGYAHNQEQELRRVLLDIRLPLDNNRSERALRRIVVGRKNWMFYGSDVHADSAAAIFSIIASCRLHRIEPRNYLCEVLRVLPNWPKDRYIELAPHQWRRTRSLLSTDQLLHPVCEVDVPP